MIFEHRREETAEHNPFPKEIEVLPAFMCAEGGLANKAFDPMLFHPCDDVGGAERADPAFAGHACAQGDDDRVVPLDGVGHGGGNGGVARLTNK